MIILAWLRSVQVERQSKSAATKATLRITFIVVLFNEEKDGVEFLLKIILGLIKINLSRNMTPVMA